MKRFDFPTGPRGLNQWLEVAPWPIHHIGPEGQPHRANPALASLLGYSPDAMDSTRLAQCIPTRTHRRIREALETPHNGSHIETELEYLHRDGVELVARQARIGPLDEPSVPPLVMLDGLQPSQKLDRARVQSRMARLVAHDLNNVFTVAQSYVDLVRRQNPTSRVSANYISRAARAIRRGIRVSRQLQTIIIEKPFPTEECDLTEVLDVLQPFLARLLPTGPKWSIHYQHSLPALLSHPALLGRFLIDFSINAHLRWPQCRQFECRIRRSPGHQQTVVMRVRPPEQSGPALPVPFRLYLCQTDPFTPDQVDPLFVTGILANHPIAIDKADHSLTALLPGME